MKHICVIGNSHVGALKAGYDELENPACKFSFWSIPGGGGPNLTIQSNRITVSKHQAQRIKTDISYIPSEGLDISRYDAILLSGVGMPAIRKQFNHLHKKYVLAEFLAAEAEDKQILSQEVFSTLIERALQKLPTFQNIRKIASIFKKEIYIQLFPLPTPDVVGQQDFDVYDYGADTGRFLSWYYSTKINVIEKSLPRRNLSLIHYPQSWLNSGFTPMRYKSAGDAWHMNTAFGRYFIEHLMPTVVTDLSIRK